MKVNSEVLDTFAFRTVALATVPSYPKAALDFKRDNVGAGKCSVGFSSYSSSLLFMMSRLHYTIRNHSVETLMPQT